MDYISSVDQDLANFSQVNFWEFMIPSRIMQDAPLMPLLVAPADFSKKTDFWYIFVTGCYIISPWEHLSSTSSED